MSVGAFPASVAETIADLRSKRAALDEAIRSLEGIYGTPAAAADSPAAREKRKAAAAPPKPGPSEAEARAQQALLEPPRQQQAVVPPPPAKPLYTGQWDERIVKALALAGEDGMGPRDLVVAVVGASRVEALYQTVYTAASTLVRRGLIRKDGRFFHPVRESA